MISLSTFLTLRALHEEGVPKKTMARRLGLDVRTVRSWLKKIESGESSPKQAPRPSKLDAYRDQIEEMVERGCSAVQIHSHLVAANSSLDVSYESVKRLVRKVRPRKSVCYQRMTFAPGSEAQIDFGEVSSVLEGGRRRRRWLFCMTLCFSRLAYHELVFDQRVPTFLAAIRRGFEYFGGVPGRLKPDNLRSAVLISGLGERVYQKDFFEFCRHYGTVPDAARPRTPTDKGRVERDIRYVKGSFFRGREKHSHDEDVIDLARWREDVANQRIHGTTRKRPADLFEREKEALRPLPSEPFEQSEWGSYRVRKDCHIHIAGNYYSVPHRLVGEKVEVRLREQDLAVFHGDIAVAHHERLSGKGQSSTQTEHYPKEKRTATQEIHRQRLLTVRSCGPASSRFLSRLRQSRFVFRDQVLRMLRLIERYGATAVEDASRRALYFEAVDSARRLERILERGLEKIPLPGTQRDDRHHSANDFGRSLSEYQDLLKGEFQA